MSLTIRRSTFADFSPVARGVRGAFAKLVGGVVSGPETERGMFIAVEGMSIYALDSESRSIGANVHQAVIYVTACLAKPQRSQSRASR
jgi:hypothetical protein